MVLVDQVICVFCADRRLHWKKVDLLRQSSFFSPTFASASSPLFFSPSSSREESFLSRNFFAAVGQREVKEREKERDSSSSSSSR